MINSNIQDICSHLGMSKAAFNEGFSELKRRGFLFTPAKTVKEFITDEYPTRLAMIGPTSEQPNVLSTGPFAVSRAFYDQYFLKMKSLLSADALGVLLMFKRVEYEKFGAFRDQSITIESDEDSFIDVACTSGIYDLSQPHVYSDFVWFDVTDEYKTKGQPDLETEKSVSEFWWWRVLIEFDEGFIPPIPSDQPEDYSLIPDWYFEFPKRYMPEVIVQLLLKLFSHVTLGLDIENLVLDEDELIEIIDSIFDQYAYSSESAEAIDRELLVKELCDYNGYTYPIDAKTTISYLRSTGFISTTENQTTYELTMTFEIPAEFTVTDEWEEKFCKFVETGSVLFAYMSFEEIVT